MWAKIRRRPSRTKASCDSNDVTNDGCSSSKDVEHLKIVKKTPTKNIRGLVAVAYKDRSESINDENAIQNEHDGCRCSPLLSLHKHFFSSFKKRTNVELSRNEISCEIPPENCENILPEEANARKNASTNETTQFVNKEIDGDKMNHVKIINETEVFHREVNAIITEPLAFYDVSDDDSDEVGRTFVMEMEITENQVSSCDGLKVSPPKLKRKEKCTANDTTETRNSVLTGLNGRITINRNPLDDDLAKVTELPENTPNWSDESKTGESQNSKNEKVFDFCIESQASCNDARSDKVESVDSGLHTSDGDVDVEKGHSSPDLDIDELEGIESGYTTLDDFQPPCIESNPVFCDDDVVLRTTGLIGNGLAPPALSSVLVLKQMVVHSSISQVNDDSLSRVVCSNLTVARTADSAFSIDFLLSGGHSGSGAYRSGAFSGSVETENVRQWEHVDYVPADVSVSKIYEEASNSTSCDVYAFVPRPLAVTKLEDVASEIAVSGEMMESSDKLNHVESRSLNAAVLVKNVEGLDDLQGAIPIKVPASSGGVALSCEEDLFSDGRAFCTVAVDSDDGENVPPLPSRNYETYVMDGSGSVIKSPGVCCHESEVLKSCLAEDDDERIHMTWDELMKEAKCLGIPLSGPQSDSDKPHGVSPPRRTNSECIFRLAVQKKSTDEDREMEQTSASAVKAVETRKGSPFKEKFRLHNPFFSKKNKVPEKGGGGGGGSKDDNDQRLKQSQMMTALKGKKSIFRHHSSSAVDIQKRSLPRPPPDEHLFLDLTRDDHVPSSSKLSQSCRMAVSLHLPSSSNEESDGNATWGSAENIPYQGISNADRNNSRGVYLGSSSQQLGAAARLPLPIHDLASDAGICLEPLSSSLSTANSNADFIQSFSRLKDCGWYWGPLGWENAEAKLEDKSDGSFLVRDSSDDRYILSLSFRSQNMTHHTRIEHYKGMFSFYSQPKSHGASTIVEFITKAMEHSRSGQFLYFLRPRAPGLPPAPVQLLFPVSRLRNMHSLQHICRFVILRHVRRDLIDRLPIPPRLKEYLKQTQYYVENLDADPTGHQYFSQEW